MSKTAFQLLLLVLLISSATATFINTEFFLSNPCKNGKIKRVSKMVRVDYDHQISAGDYWKTYPGLELQVTIPFHQVVSITYQIGLWASQNWCHFATRVLINNVE